MSVIKPQSNNVIVLQKFILDPLSTIIKLAVLGKKNIGCKISISNNQIYIQDIGIFQGIARYYLGLTKNDIHYLSIPIEIACKRYLINNRIKEIPKITTIFKCAQQGLTNLMDTYIDYPIIIHCLKYYNSIIDSHLHLIECEQNQQLLNNNKIVDKDDKIINKDDKINNDSFNYSIYNPNQNLYNKIKNNDKSLKNNNKMMIKQQKINNSESIISYVKNDD